MSAFFGKPLELPLPPSGVNNAYHTGKGGRWYKDKDVKDWEEECLWLLKPIKKWTKFNKGVVIVNIQFYFPNNRFDIDSKIKFVLDMLQKAGAYQNDREVTQLWVVKHIDKKNPHMKVQVY